MDAPRMTINLPADPAESKFRPDVYPTPRAAMAALVPQVIAAINELPAGTVDAGMRVLVRDRDALETLQKTGRDRAAASAEPCLRQLPDALRENFPQLDVRSNEDLTTCPDPRLVVQVSTKDVRTTRVSWSRNPCVSATMLVSIGVETPPGPTTAPSTSARKSAAAPSRTLTKLSAKFTDRGWADAPAEFPNGTWTVAGTPNPVESVNRAEDVAFEQAANPLTPRVAERAGIVAGVGSQRVSAQIKAALKRGDACVADKFAQSFQRPYGTVYAEQLLIDASPDKLGALARRVASAARAETAVRTVQVEETRTTFKQVLGFMLVVLVLYWFLNAATKGYFTWQLRAGAVLLVLAGVVMIVATAGYLMVPRAVVIGH